MWLQLYVHTTGKSRSIALLTLSPLVVKLVVCAALPKSSAPQSRSQTTRVQTTKEKDGATVYRLSMQKRRWYIRFATIIVVIVATTTRQLAICTVRKPCTHCCVVDWRKFGHDTFGLMDAVAVWFPVSVHLFISAGECMMERQCGTFKILKTKKEWKQACAEEFETVFAQEKLHAWQKL